MKKKRHTTEEIIRTLREANGGKTLEAVCRAANISEQTFYRWRRKYGRMGTADARPLKKLVRRIVHLRPRVSTLRLPEDCCGRAGRRVKTRLPCPQYTTRLAHGYSAQNALPKNLPIRSFPGKHGFQATRPFEAGGFTSLVF